MNSNNEYSETHYRVLRMLQDNPELSQRQLSESLGVSLGKANYLVQALIQKGWVKARNFKNSKNKAAYAYYLTPNGIDEMARMTYDFLKKKQAEYEVLKKEIESLKKEVQISRVPLEERG